LPRGVPDRHTVGALYPVLTPSANPLIFLLTAGSGSVTVQLMSRSCPASAYDDVGGDLDDLLARLGGGHATNNEDDIDDDTGLPWRPSFETPPLTHDDVVAGVVIGVGLPLLALALL